MRAGREGQMIAVSGATRTEGMVAIEGLVGGLGRRKGDCQLRQVMSALPQMYLTVTTQDVNALQFLYCCVLSILEGLRFPAYVLVCWNSKKCINSRVLLLDSYCIAICIYCSNELYNLKSVTYIFVLHI